MGIPPSLPSHIPPNPNLSTLLPPQIRILAALRPRIPRQTPLRNRDIRLNILDQALHTHIVILRPDIAQDADGHLAAVEILLELVHDVHLGAAHRVLVEGVVPDRHHHREDAPALRDLVRWWCLGVGGHWLE